MPTVRWSTLEDEADDAADAASRAAKRRKVQERGGPAAGPAGAAPKLRGILASGGGSGGARKVRWADGDGAAAAGFSIGGASTQQVCTRCMHSQVAAVPRQDKVQSRRQTFIKVREGL